MNKPLPKQQLGVALISVLLVFAIAAAIAGEVMSRHYRDIRKTANFINGKQAYHFALSGEQYARQVLYRDFDEQRDEQEKFDTLNDIWAANFPAFNIEGGEMFIEVTDLQGRMNINQIAESNNAAAIEAFRRLGDILALNDDYSDRLLDWLDADNLVSPEGAEDVDYSNGYLPANRAMADVSEMLLLRDMAVEDFLKLQPLLTALPDQIGGKTLPETKYNINTVDAKLLEAIANLTASEAQQVVEQQQRGGHENINNWYSGAIGAKLNAKRHLLTGSSSFFEIRVTVSYQQRIVVLTTQLYRNPEDGSIRIINRQIGNAASAAAELVSL